MKINEKNLCAFAISTNFAADKEGYLMKKGEVNKGFQKRWFVLKGNLLFYFEKRYDKEPLGVIILEGCTIELDENDAQFSFKIVFHGMGNRSYVLCADSQEAMEQWMKSLACSSYDYMKLMVTDLQRQLKETRCNKVTSKTKESDKHAESSSSISFGINADNSLADPWSSFQNQGSSPNPPPRTRHNAHQKSHGNSPKTGNVSFPSQQFFTSGNNSHANLRTKITFKDVHTTYGRPVLRDRNEWRYQKRDQQQQQETQKSTSHSAKSNPPQFREQNLLISL